MHFLITRYSICEPTWSHVVNEAWMEERLGLFKRYCLASVAGQTDQDFEWILLVDEGTDSKWLEQLNELREIRDFILLPTTINWLEELQKYIKGMSPSGHIITTRMDSDDAIAPEYLGLVKSHFRRQKKTIVDAPNGYLYDGTVLNEYSRIGSCFASLIERGRETIYFIPHGRRILQYYHSIISHRQWLQVIHNRNATNIMRGDLVEKPRGWVRSYL